MGFNLSGAIRGGVYALHGQMKARREQMQFQRQMQLEQQKQENFMQQFQAQQAQFEARKAQWESQAASERSRLAAMDATLKFNQERARETDKYRGETARATSTYRAGQLGISGQRADAYTENTRIRKSVADSKIGFTKFKMDNVDNPNAMTSKGSLLKHFMGLYKMAYNEEYDTAQSRMQRVTDEDLEIIRAKALETARQGSKEALDWYNEYQQRLANTKATVTPGSELLLGPKPAEQLTARDIELEFEEPKDLRGSSKSPAEINVWQEFLEELDSQRYIDGELTESEEQLIKLNDSSMYKEYQRIKIDKQERDDKARLKKARQTRVLSKKAKQQNAPVSVLGHQ